MKARVGPASTRDLSPSSAQTLMTKCPNLLPLPTCSAHPLLLLALPTYFTRLLLWLPAWSLSMLSGPVRSIDPLALLVLPAFSVPAASVATCLLCPPPCFYLLGF